MPWIRRKLRGTNVFVKTDAAGKPAVDGALVEIVYRLDGEPRVYRASVRNLEATGDPADEQPREGPACTTPAPRQNPTPTPTPKAASRKRGAAPKDDPIVIYTDGACTGNPGPAGLGAVIMDGDSRRELSEYLGHGTNNIAELTAVQRALEALAPRDRTRRILLHTDSSYSIGVLTQNWKAKANQALIADIRELLTEFPNLELVKVRGHAGIPENERADELARQAVEQGM